MGASVSFSLTITKQKGAPLEMLQIQILNLHDFIFITFGEINKGADYWARGL